MDGATVGYGRRQGYGVPENVVPIPVDTLTARYQQVERLSDGMACAMVAKRCEVGWKVSMMHCRGLNLRFGPFYV